MKRLVLLLTVFSIGMLQAQMPKQLNSAEIYQKIEKINVLGNVLYLAAHPDDENQRLISFCANEKLYNTAYLSLTRGDGGQNLIGTEITEELGIIRTQELLAARRTDGGQQFFSRANDFGYSKTSEETLKIWGKDVVLSDVVWVIRKFRPDVIVCRFPTDGGGGHGHHTASAILAMEAYDIAGDKNVYPEQLQYVDVWQPTRVVVNTGRWWNDSISANDPGVVVEDLGVYNEILGTSYTELSARSRSNHKCQGFGATGERGEKIEYFEHEKGLEAKNSLFDGYKSDWSRVKGASTIELMGKEIAENFKLSNPSASIPSLIKMRTAISKLEDKFWKEIKLIEIDDLIIQAAGIYIEASADEFSKTEGDSLKVNFELINRSNVAVFVNGISSNSLNFEETLTESLNDNLNMNLQRGFVMPDLNITQPYWLAEEVSLGSTKVSDQQLRGTPENKAIISFSVTLNIAGQKITKDYPLIYKWNDPVDGESYRPFVVMPKVTVNLDQPIYLYSDKMAHSVILNLKAGDDNQSGTIEVKSPDGWELSYIRPFNMTVKGEEKKVEVSIKAYEGAQAGMLKVFVNGKQSKAMNTIEYDHIPTQVWFPDAEAQLVYVDIKKTGNKLGYLLGAGDVVPEALRNIGYEVDILEESGLTQGNLKKYDAILIGIRYFNVNERAPYEMPKLLEYVKAGGNLIVQYNTRHRMITQDFAPYPITLGRDRVTEEDAQVTFINKDHPVMNVPNKLTPADFDNWVQERGLYFPSEWDNQYETILSWHDEGEDAKEGSLLVAKYGKGNYVYTGISFFRELPAGVPGAYRLLVNLISLDQ